MAFGPIELVLGLFVVIVALAYLARRVGVAYPILLVIGGLIAVLCLATALRARLSRDEHRRRRALPVHLGIGHRGPPGQDVRSDL